MIQAIAWKDAALEILDQTRLPAAEVYLRLQGVEEVFEAIQRLRVRGAPAIGIAAAYGLYLAMRDVPLRSPEEFFQVLAGKIEYLASARPTAVNLSWALHQVRRTLEPEAQAGVDTLKRRLLELAQAIHADDRQRCERIAEHGQSLVPPSARILTHCHTGALATGGIGTALGVIRQAHETGKQIQVYATETRPLLQGARLTMWELAKLNIPAQLLCDSMAAALMRQKALDLVIVGADRIAADGSVANKIGTYQLAVAARHHEVPFYVAAPLSTVDPALEQGSRIPIEMRAADEVRRVLNQALITLPDAPCWNPAFDVTPPELITAIITERGVIYPPYGPNLRAMFS